MVQQQENNQRTTQEVEEERPTIIVDDLENGSSSNDDTDADADDNDNEKQMFKIYEKSVEQKLQSSRKVDKENQLLNLDNPKPKQVRRNKTFFV